MKKPLALTCLVLAASASLLPAQTLTVRLLNAKSGKPLPNKNVTFHWSPGKGSSVVLVDANGIGHVTLPPNISQFILVEGPRLGKEPDRIAFADCNANSSTLVPVAEVLTHGVAPRDICHNRTLPPHPGEIIFWGEPRSNWLPDFQWEPLPFFLSFPQAICGCC